MATEVKLKLSIEGGRIVSQEIDGVTHRMGDMRSASVSTNASFAELGAQAIALTRTFAGLAAIQKAVAAAGDYAGLASRINLLTGSAENAELALQSITDIAQRQGANLQAVGDSYAKIGQAMVSLGGTSADTARMVETVAGALRLGNASTAEANSAMRQFGQAMAKGKLNGDEFVSLMENAPYLMDAVAASLGKTKGDLFAMAEAGQLTAQVFGDAVLGSFDAVTGKAATLAPTIGQAMERITTAFTLAASESNAVNLATTAAFGAMGVAAEHAGLILGVLTNGALVALANQTMVATSAIASKVTATLAERAANVANLQSTVASAEAIAAETAAKIVSLQASVAGVEMSRAEVMAKLQATRTTMAQASAQLAAAQSAGALSFALAMAREATVTLTGAQTRQTALITELAALGAVQATVQTSIARATAAHTAATLAQTGAQTALNTATSIGTRALGVLGGPIGLITTALGLGLTAWSLWGSSAKEGEEKATAAVERSTASILSDLDNQIERIKRRNALAGQKMGVNGLDLNSPAADRLGALQLEINQLRNPTSEADLVKRNKLLAEQGQLQQKIIELEQSSAPERAANGVNAHADAMAKYGPQVDKATAAIEAERKALGAAFTPELETRIKAHFAAKKSGTTVVSDAAKGLALYNDLMDKTAGFDKSWAENTNTLRAALDGKTISQDQYNQAITVLFAKQPLMADAAKAEADALKATTAAREDGIKAQSKATQSAQDALAKQLVHNATIGLGTAALGALAAANLELQAVELERKASLQDGVMWDTAITDGYLKEAKALRDLASAKVAGATKQVGADATKDMAAEQKKAAEESSKYWEDALMRAFESGKGFFESLWDTIKNTLKTQVLKVTVQGVMGTLGIGASGAATAGGSGGGNLLGTAASLGKMYDTITGGFTTLTASVSGGLQHAADWMMTSSSDMVAKLGESLSANVGGLSTAFGYAAGAAAGLAVGNAISGQFGSSNTVTAGTIIGSIVGGPIGGAIGGAIGGLVNRAFGMGNTEVQAQGTRGEFAASGQFSGQNYANMHQSGGLFRGDKNWTEATALDGKTSQSWSDAFVGIKIASANMAVSLGLTTEKIAAYTKYIDIAAGTTAEQMTALFVGMADDMATAAAPGLEMLVRVGETASVTLGRLSSSLVTVNQWLGALDQKLLAVSLIGGDFASQLADTFGGMDKLTTASKAYYDSFWTDAERLTDTAVNVAKGLALVGQAMPASKEAFRAVVSGLDLTTAAGRNTYAVMLALAPEFATVADATVAATKLITDAFDKLQTSLTGLLASITSERTAVADAKHNILNPGGRPYAQIQADVAEASLSKPGTSALDTASATQSLAGVQLQAAKETYATWRLFLADTTNYRTAYIYWSDELIAYKESLQVGSLNAAAAAKVAADTAAQKALDDYTAAINVYASDASKAVTTLGKLREETVAYYEAQKALANGMASSATNLRTAALAVRTGQLDSTQSLAQKQADFAKNYSLALATTGSTQAGYADKLAAALPDLSAALANTATTRAEWVLATAALTAQSTTVANALDAGATALSYEANSLSLLTTIDSALAVMQSDAGIISAAIKAGADQSSNGTAAIINAILGNTAAPNPASWVPTSAKPVLLTAGEPAVAIYPGYAVGSNYIPFDHTARVHAGEEITPRPYVDQQRAARDETNNLLRRLLASNEVLERDNANMRRELRAVATHAATSSKALRDIKDRGITVNTDADRPLNVVQ